MNAILIITCGGDGQLIMMTFKFNRCAGVDVPN